MTEIDARLTEMILANVVLAAMVFARVSGIVAFLPGFGERSIPVRVKLAVAVSFTIVALPVVPMPAAVPAPVAGIASEAAIGALVGLALRLMVMALQTAGSIAAQSTSLAQLLGGASVEPTPAIGYILVLSGLTLAVMTGLHIKCLGLFVISYELIPLGSLPGGADVGAWGAGAVARAFALAFSLALPFVALGLIYNLALGAINKAMPQLMVAFVGAPAITAAGLVLLVLAGPTILAVWVGALDRTLLDPFGATR